MLERGTQNGIVRIEPKTAYPYLLRQTYRPDSPEAMRKTLMLLNRLTETVAFWRLKCNMEPDAARVSYEAMRRDGR